MGTPAHWFYIKFLSIQSPSQPGWWEIQPQPFFIVLPNTHGPLSRIVQKSWGGSKAVGRAGKIWCQGGEAWAPWVGLGTVLPHLSPRLCLAPPAQKELLPPSLLIEPTALSLLFRLQKTFGGSGKNHPRL